MEILAYVIIGLLVVIIILLLMASTERTNKGLVLLKAIHSEKDPEKAARAYMRGLTAWPNGRKKVDLETKKKIYN